MMLELVDALLLAMEVDAPTQFQIDLVNVRNAIFRVVGWVNLAYLRRVHDRGALLNEVKSTYPETESESDE